MDKGTSAEELPKMTSFRDFLKEGTTDDDVRKVLAAPPDVLKGVSAAAAADLAKLQVDRVFDLGASRLFGTPRNSPASIRDTQE